MTIGVPPLGRPPHYDYVEVYAPNREHIGVLIHSGGHWYWRESPRLPERVRQVTDSQLKPGTLDTTFLDTLRAWLESRGDTA